ncbi:MAG: flagella basal body P-ring formation protein FlgA [Myxococcota bacterium]
MIEFLAFAAFAAPVVVQGDHVLLADIVDRVPARYAGIEIAPAPLPGKSKVITRRRVRRRLVEANASARGLSIPQRVVVTRAAQSLDEFDLRELLEPKIRASAPDHVRVRRVQVRGALTLPAGEIDLDIQWPKRPRGTASLRVLVSVDGAYAASTLATVELDMREDAAPVKRGDRVTVVARVGSVTVRGVGIAQHKARVGEILRVLPDRAVRVVEGEVRPDGAVEVRP